jgi:hypothetical protein
LSFEDALSNLYQTIEVGDPQYVGAQIIGMLIADVPALQTNVMATGHSLGGGLASAASVAGGIPTTTYNAAHLARHTLCQPGTYVAPDPGSSDPAEQLGVCQEIAEGSLGRYDANGAGLITAYRVWWSEGARPDGSADVPDILSMLQAASPFVPEALGVKENLEGLLNFAPKDPNAAKSEYERAIIIRDAISNITALPQTLQDWLNITLLVYNVANNLSAIEKMVQSHSIAESVMFGLLHDDATGWNAYDDNNPNLND